MKKGIDVNIEALRGFCALIVFIHHCIIFSNFMVPGYDFRHSVIPYSPSGHLMVLIFFMLSGYVIGLTSANKSNFNTVDYLKRRIVRLYPIYIIAIAITAVLFLEKTNSILGAVFFVQNLLTDNLIHNPALWSLNHEFVYYILVIPVLIFTIRPSFVFFLLGFLLIASLIKLEFPIIIEGYLTGFIFWMTGFAISKKKISQVANSTIMPDKLVALFFLLLSCDFLNLFALGRLFDKLKFLHAPSLHYLDDMVSVNDFSLLPFCLYAIITTSCVNIKWGKFLTLFVYCCCWGHVIYLMLNGSFFKVNFFYLPALFLLISTILLFAKFDLFKTIDFWTRIGSISYAIYVIHMPLLRIMNRLKIFEDSPTISFLTHLIILSVAVVALSYLLEKKLQPYFKSYFLKSFTIT